MTGRRERENLPLHNIPIRTELGAKLRADLREARSMWRIWQSLNYSNLEMRILANYAAGFVKRSP